MAIRFGLKVEDEDGNEIEMEEAINERGGEVYDFDFQVNVAVDKSTGKITGQRQYAESSFTKPICKATPIFFQKLVEGKKVKKVEITLFRIDPKEGNEKAFYQYTFEDVAFVSQAPIVLDTTVEANRNVPPLEKIGLVAEKITQTFIDGNISHTDEYRAKAASAA